MWTVFYVVLVVAGVVLFYVVLATPLLDMLQYVGVIRVRCPHRDTQGGIHLDPERASFAGTFGAPSLRVVRCSLLGPGESCDQACLKHLPKT